LFLNETYTPNLALSNKMPLSLLNEEQLNAATAESGRNIVIASAGTGKRQQ